RALPIGDPLRRHDLPPLDPIRKDRPVRPYHVEIPYAARPKIEHARHGREAVRAEPSGQVPGFRPCPEDEIPRALDDPGADDLPVLLPLKTFLRLHRLFPSVEVRRHTPRADRSFRSRIARS